MNKLILTILFFVATEGFASSTASASALETSEKTEIKPLAFVCSHEKLPTFSLLGTIHTLEFESLDKKAQAHLLSYDRFIGETGADPKEKPLTYEDFGRFWGYRENDDDFDTFIRSDKYKSLTPEEQIIFHRLSQHNLSLPHTYYLFTTEINDEEYVQGIDETLEAFYKEKGEGSYYYLLNSQDTLKSLAFFKELSYKDFVDEDEGEDSDDDTYPETLETATLSLKKENTKPSLEEQFRLRDTLFMDSLFNILDEQKLRHVELKTLVGVGVNHLPAMTAALEKAGFTISQIDF